MAKSLEKQITPVSAVVVGGYDLKRLDISRIANASTLEQGLVVDTSSSNNLQQATNETISQFEQFTESRMALLGCPSANLGEEYRGDTILSFRFILP